MDIERAMQREMERKENDAEGKSYRRGDKDNRDAPSNAGRKK